MSSLDLPAVKFRLNSLNNCARAEITYDESCSKWVSTGSHFHIRFSIVWLQGHVTKVSTAHFRPELPANKKTGSMAKRM